MSGVEASPLLLALALSPIALLFAIVLGGRLRTPGAAAVVLVWATALAATAFGAGPRLLAVAGGKGLWLAAWILAVVLPALLLYRVAETGGLDRLGDFFATLLPDRAQSLLVVAWVLPALVQGVAGFGTPIAVTAPLLRAMGYDRVRSVAYPLVGYCWSVTFGSMGSSFYMASLTAGLDGAAREQLALRAAGLLAGVCLLAGALVLLLDGGRRGLRRGGGVLLAVWLPMAAALVGTAPVVPAVATLAAGGTGIGVSALLAIAVRRRAARRRTATPVAERPPVAPAGPGAGGAVGALAPYLFLLVTALPVLLIPASRAWAQRWLVLAPAFPATRTSRGWANEAVAAYTPLEVFAHPGTYILFAALLGLLAYRALGWWRPGAGGPLLRAWLRSLPAAGTSILLFAVLAALLVEAGMVAVLARGAADVVGAAFPALAPLVGAVGSFVTGSTTSSNALFAALQADLAGLIEVEPTWLVAAQTVGGNIGNSLAPVILLVGLTAVGGGDALGAVLRRCLLPAGVLLAAVTVAVVVAVTL